MQGKTVFVEILQYGPQLPRILGEAMKFLLHIDITIETASLVGCTWVLDPDDREWNASRATVIGVRANDSLKIRAWGQLD